LRWRKGLSQGKLGRNANLVEKVLTLRVREEEITPIRRGRSLTEGKKSFLHKRLGDFGKGAEARLTQFHYRRENDVRCQDLLGKNRSARADPKGRTRKKYCKGGGTDECLSYKIALF